MPSWERFINPEREERQPPDRLLSALEWQGVARVLDVGCGPGFWSVPAAGRLEAGGWLAALDSSPEMVSVVRDRAGSLPVIPCRGSADELPFDAGSFHRVFLANLLHEVPDPRRVVTEAFRCLRPGGELLVVDFEAVETAFGPPLRERIRRETMVDQLSSSVGAPDSLPCYDDFYVLRVRK